MRLNVMLEVQRRRTGFAPLPTSGAEVEGWLDEGVHKGGFPLAGEHPHVPRGERHRPHRVLHIRVRDLPLWVGLSRTVLIVIIQIDTGVRRSVRGV